MTPEDKKDRGLRLQMLRQEKDEMAARQAVEVRQRQERQYRAAAVTQEIYAEVVQDVVTEEVRAIARLGNKLFNSTLSPVFSQSFPIYA